MRTGRSNGRRRTGLSDPGPAPAWPFWGVRLERGSGCGHEWIASLKAGSGSTSRLLVFDEQQRPARSDAFTFN
ncbi:hypothetical protein MTO96_009819 [Rhipicephalus appendiculatus]